MASFTTHHTDQRLKASIGAKVSVKGKAHDGGDAEGILLYFGVTAKSEGVKKCGVEFVDEGIGKHDGSVNGKRYFQCRPGHGALVPVEKVRIIGQTNDIRKAQPKATTKKKKTKSTHLSRIESSEEKARLRAENEELKRRIAALETKAGKSTSSLDGTSIKKKKKKVKAQPTVETSSENTDAAGDEDVLRASTTTTKVKKTKKKPVSEPDAVDDGADRKDPPKKSKPAVSPKPPRKNTKTKPGKVEIRPQDDAVNPRLDVDTDNAAADKDGKYGAGTIAKPTINSGESHQPDLSQTGVKAKMKAMLAFEKNIEKKNKEMAPKTASRKDFKWKVDHKVAMAAGGVYKPDASVVPDVQHPGLRDEAAASTADSESSASESDDEGGDAQQTSVVQPQADDGGGSGSGGFSFSFATSDKPPEEQPKAFTPPPTKSEMAEPVEEKKESSDVLSGVSFSFATSADKDKAENIDTADTDAESAKLQAESAALEARLAELNASGSETDSEDESESDDADTTNVNADGSWSVQSNDAAETRPAQQQPKSNPFASTGSEAVANPFADSLGGSTAPAPEVNPFAEEPSGPAVAREDNPFADTTPKVNPFGDGSADTASKTAEPNPFGTPPTVTPANPFADSSSKPQANPFGAPPPADNPFA